MLSSQKIPQTITECIEILAYNDHFWEGFSPHHKDRKTITSLAQSDYAWTEKQAKLGLIIVKRYKSLFEKYDLNITNLCDNPIWRDKFRKIDYEKVLEKYINDDNEDEIEIKFPYNKKIIALIRCLKDSRGLPAGYLQYNGEEKVWTAKYSDVVVYFLTLLGIRYDFKITDPSMLDDFDSIREERKQHKHLKVYAGKTNLAIANASESLNEYWEKNIKNKNLLQQIDSLKQFNISLPAYYVKEVSSLSEKIAVANSKDIWVDANKWNREQLLTACDELDLFPLIVPIREVSSIEDLHEYMNWLYAFERAGIKEKQLAFGFDFSKTNIASTNILQDFNPPTEIANTWQKKDKQWLSEVDPFIKMVDPSQENPYKKDISKEQKENIYKDLKKLHLMAESNKYIDKNTKIIFIRNRIPRTLIKSSIRPRTSLNFIRGTYAPYSEFIRKWLDNIEKKLYYNTVQHLDNIVMKRI